MLVVALALTQRLLVVALALTQRLLVVALALTQRLLVVALALTQRLLVVALALTQRLLVDHVESTRERQFESGLEDVDERRDGLDTGAERTEDEVEEGTEEADGPGEDHQHDEPHDAPQPAALAHCVVSIVSLLLQMTNAGGALNQHQTYKAACARGWGNRGGNRLQRGQLPPRNISHWLDEKVGILARLIREPIVKGFQLLSPSPSIHNVPTFG